MRFLKLITLLFIGNFLWGQDSVSSQHFARLNQNSSQLKIYSSAYLHYERIFGELNVDFDSAILQERYLDTMYIGTRLRVAMCQGCEKMQQHYLSTFFRKEAGVKKFMMNFPQGSVNLKRKPALELLSDTIQRKHWRKMGLGFYNFIFFYKRYKKCFSYSDYRLFYVPGNTYFILQLKTLSGFEEWNVRLENTSSNNEKAAEEHQDFYDDYLKTLSKTEKYFNSDLEKRLARHHRNQQKRYEQSWQSFRRVYFSPEELKMSKEEWMDYYDRITQNEFVALKNSPPKNELLQRFLAAYSYQPLTLNLRSFTNFCYPRFMLDSTQQKILMNYMVIRTGSKLYSSERSGVNINDYPLIPSLSGGEIIIGQDISGRFFTGVVPGNLSTNSTIVEIILNPIGRDLASIGMLFSKFNL